MKTGFSEFCMHKTRARDQWLCVSATGAVVVCIVMLSGCGSGNKVSTTQNVQTATGSDTPSGFASPARSCTVVAVRPAKLHYDLELPGNLEAFEDVPLYAKVEGYVSAILVDRGAHVTSGQTLVKIDAPELNSKVKEAYSRVSSADAAYNQALATLDGIVSKLTEAKAKLSSDKLTAQRLREAGTTPGAIAQNDIDMADKTVEADEARSHAISAEVTAAQNLVKSQKNNVAAAQSVYESVLAMRSYLEIKAPFNGVITERNVHPGSIVTADGSRGGSPMLRLQLTKTLRLTVAVPESSVSGIRVGAKVPFSVPAYAGRLFFGTVARPALALDLNTRTMPVEVSVNNSSDILQPGMFATVFWKVEKPYNTLFVPNSAVAADLKGTYVLRVEDGKIHRVRVTKGPAMGEEVEVSGNLRANDLVALKATNEIPENTPVKLEKAVVRNVDKFVSSGPRTQSE